MFKKLYFTVMAGFFASVVLFSLGVVNEARAQQGWCWEWSANCAPVMNNTSNTNSGDSTPPQDSGGSQPTRTVIVDRFGAVALNAKTGTYGYAQQKSSKEEAQTAAIADCNDGCSIVGTYSNQCAAYVKGIQPTGYGLSKLGFGKSKPVAEQNALAACGKKAKNCQILMSECSIVGQ